MGFGAIAVGAHCGDATGEGIVHKEVDEQDATAAIIGCGAGSWQVSGDSAR